MTIIGTAAITAATLAGLCAQSGLAQPAEQPLTPREKMMLERIEQLEKRLAALESRAAPQPALRAEAPSSDQQPALAAAAPAADKSPASLPDLLRGTTLNVLLDGYYAYNFDKPIGRVNYLRAF